MAKIPDAASLGARAIPQSQRSIVSFDGGAGAKALVGAGQQVQQLGAEAEALAKEQKTKRDRLIAGRSMLDAMKADSDFIEQARANPQGYAAFKDEHAKVFQKNKSNILANAEVDDYQKELLSLALDEQFTKTQSVVSDISRGFRKNHVVADLGQRKNDIEKMAYDNPDSVPALIASYNATADGYFAAGDIDEDFAVKDKLTLAEAVKAQTQKRGEIDWGLKTDAEKLAILQGANQPLNVRNNNPGNIRGADGQFRQFATPDEGMAEMERDLGVKVSGNSAAMKKNFGAGYVPSIRNIITTWAPKSENDTNAYVASVAKDSGLDPDAPLSKDDIKKIMPAMIKVEGGSNSMAYYAIKDPAFARMSPENQAKWMNPEQQKKIVENIATNELSTSPQPFIAKLNAGEYDKYFNAADKLKYKEMAIKVMDNQAQVEKNTRLAYASTRNTELYNKLLVNDPSLMDDVAKFRSEANTVEDIEFADSIRDSYLKMNPISAEEKADISAELNAELSGFKNQEKDDIDLADMLRYQQRVIKASARGVPGLNHIISKISPVINYLADKEQGSDDKGWKIFGEAVEVYDAGYQTIQDHLEKIGKQDDVVMKQKMLSDFVEASDAIPDNIRSDKSALDKQLGVIAKNVISIYANKRTPSLRVLDDTPNGVVKSDGTIENLGGFDTAVKADTKVDDIQVFEGKDKNGVPARQIFRNGKLVKTEVLNPDGTVNQEIFETGGAPVKEQQN